MFSFIITNFLVTTKFGVSQKIRGRSPNGPRCYRSVCFSTKGELCVCCLPTIAVSDLAKSRESCQPLNRLRNCLVTRLLDVAHYFYVEYYTRIWYLGWHEARSCLNKTKQIKRWTATAIMIFFDWQTIAFVICSSPDSDKRNFFVAPVFHKPLKDLSTSQGECLVLECRVKGQPPPTIEWRREGDLIEDCPDFRILHRGSESIFSLLAKTSKF